MLIPDPETSGEETKQVRTQISKSSRFPLESHDTVSPTRSSIRFSLSSYISIDRFCHSRTTLDPDDFPHHKHTYRCACVPCVTKPSSQTTYPDCTHLLFLTAEQLRPMTINSRLTRKLRLLRHHETKRYTKERVDGQTGFLLSSDLVFYKLALLRGLVDGIHGIAREWHIFVCI
jgi:hypothetical protein